MPELVDIDSKIIVVDNCSKDNSCEEIRRWIDSEQVQGQVEVVASPVNGGFSAGNNVGIKAVRAKYYLLLNSDTLVRKNAFKTLLSVAEQNPQAGLFSPRLEWPDATPQESCFRFHSPVSELINAACTGIVSRLLRNFVVAHPVRMEPDYYHWTSFACVLIRAEVLESIGLMDEGYFMYFEDSEFCYRAAAAGWKVMNVPDAHVVHLRGGSSPVKSQARLRKRLPRYFYESRARFFYQLYGKSGLLAANVLWIFGTLISQSRRIILPHKPRSVIEKQWRDIWVNFNKPLKPYIHPDDYDKT
ncbi:putative glycosyltransferase [Gynuella sunshinyii YC6258]|uniref:Putative glycosyltransferase n=2 Tax=Gynuella sunshinyii TaxID=1445505 RepID=A0A0C5VE69_9GAMM|nr:putative glycosyltransferase [Gynuella sunshinyii YC6258]